MILFPDSAIRAISAALKGKLRLVNFLVVGLINTAFGYSVFALTLYLGFHYSVAVAVSTVLGTLFNFKATGRLVFNSRDNSKFLRFLLVYALLYCINVASIYLLLQIGIIAYLGGLIMVLPLSLLSYYLLSRYVFKHE